MASPSVSAFGGGSDQEHHSEAAAKKKKRHIHLSRDMVIRRRQRDADRKPSPLVQLQEIFEEAQDKTRFVGDTMFWKYFEDIDTTRILDTESVEYRNLKVMFWETIFYICLLVIFTVYVYSLQNRMVFGARREQELYWSGCDASNVCSINKVQSFATFWDFMERDLVKAAFTEYAEPQQVVANIEDVFPDNPFSMMWHPRFVGKQKSNVVLGTVRLRQMRVAKNTGCQVSKLYAHIFPDCYGSYTEASKSTETYRPRFAPFYIEDCFNYKTSDETGQAGQSGRYSSYGGDGFVVDLPWNASDAGTLLGDLHKWRWVDEATRGLMVEVSTLNINVNVLVNTRMLFEFGPAGTVTGKVMSEAGPVALFTPATSTPESMQIFIMQIILLIFMALFFFYVCWLMFKTCKNFVGDSPIKTMRKQSWIGILTFFPRTFHYYIRYTWNLVDLTLIGLLVAHMALRLMTYSAMSSSPSMMPSKIGHPELFVPLSSVFAPMVHSNNMLSLCALIVWVKLFKYLCMSSYFRMLVRIMEACVSKLFVFAILLVCIFFGFSVAFFVGFGALEEDYSTLSGSFLVGFFLMLDGYDVSSDFFLPGKDVIMPIVYFVYIALVYFVLYNIAVAVVLDTYAVGRSLAQDSTEKKNPMIVFLITYFNMLLGISKSVDDAEQNMDKQDLNIKLAYLPGVVRRKWIEKKRRMQRIANDTFAGMELYAVDLDAAQQDGACPTDWALPSSRTDVFDKMNTALAQRPTTLYDIPEALGNSDVSRRQLQRLMDEDETLPILLQETKAELVIRRFRKAAEAEAEGAQATEVVGYVPPVQRLQGQVFSGIDALENQKLRINEEIQDVPEISALTEVMSDAVTAVRNKFRIELTGIIEATAVLFEHLVDLTKGIENIRNNHGEVLEVVREHTEKDMLHGMNRGGMKR